MKLGQRPSGAIDGHQGNEPCPAAEEVKLGQRPSGAIDRRQGSEACSTAPAEVGAAAAAMDVAGNAPEDLFEISVQQVATSLREACRALSVKGQPRASSLQSTR